MTVCPMCGKEFKPEEAEEYIGKLFGYDVLHKIWNDTGKICDSCCLSIYYSEHPDEK